MNKEFIPYEEALALRELGFNEPCLNFYSIYGNGKYHLQHNPVRCNKLGVEPHVVSPTYSQAFRWFREKYNLLGRIEQELSWVDSPKTRILGYSGKWCYSITNTLDYNINYNPLISSTDLFDIYEEAELACLKKLIEICKKEVKEKD